MTMTLEDRANALIEKLKRIQRPATLPERDESGRVLIPGYIAAGGGHLYVSREMDRQIAGIARVLTRVVYAAMVEAALVFVMEPHHCDKMKKRFPGCAGKLVVLGTPDDYEGDQAELVALLLEKCRRSWGDRRDRISLPLQPCVTCST
jgi:predicted protein tyrosine phosphatase